MEKQGNLSLLLLPGGVEESLSLPLLILDIKKLHITYSIGKIFIKISIFISDPPVACIARLPPLLAPQTAVDSRIEPSEERII